MMVKILRSGYFETNTVWVPWALLVQCTLGVLGLGHRCNAMHDIARRNTKKGKLTATLPHYCLIIKEAENGKY